MGHTVYGTLIQVVCPCTHNSWDIHSGSVSMGHSVYRTLIQSVCPCTLSPWDTNSVSVSLNTQFMGHSFSQCIWDTHCIGHSFWDHQSIGHSVHEVSNLSDTSPWDQLVGPLVSGTLKALNIRDIILSQGHLS